jgi:hypothetical protein
MYERHPGEGGREELRRCGIKYICPNGQPLAPCGNLAAFGLGEPYLRPLRPEAGRLTLYHR